MAPLCRIACISEKISLVQLGCPRNKQTKISVRNETNRHKICFGCVSVCFVKPKQPKQTETVQNFPKNTKICSLSNCFGWSSVWFGSIETANLSISVYNRNNRNKRFVSVSAETSFSSSFGCFESKLVSKDTLVRHRHVEDSYSIRLTIPLA